MQLADKMRKRKLAKLFLTCESCTYIRPQVHDNRSPFMFGNHKSNAMQNPSRLRIEFSNHNTIRTHSCEYKLQRRISLIKYINANTVLDNPGKPDQGF